MGKGISATLLATTALVATPVYAQDNPSALAEEIAAMRVKIEQLESKVKELEGKDKQAAAAAVPSWRGAPQLEDKKEGWSFKPIGRVQYDAGYVSRPEGLSVNNARALGFANELRRARLGVEGSIPGGFGYKFEIDFADNDVQITDAYLSYRPSKAIGITIGQHNNFQSLEELTSSNFTSFMERASFTDAFGFERRVGVSTTASFGNFIAQAGLFTDDIGSLGSSRSGLNQNEAVSVDGRLVYAPEIGNARLHVGASAHHRWLDDPGNSVSLIRYRQRPFLHGTDLRFLATPTISAERETSYGLEFASLSGPLHLAGELHWINPEGRLISPAPSIDVDPTFFGAYAEIGYFLTGETRGYRNGRWERTKVLKPLGNGGFGALQLNLRYDHVDLNRGGILGGRQNGYLASLIWIPQDHVRFLLNYGHLRYDEAAIAAAPLGDRDYSVDVVGARAQVDF